MFCRRDQMKFTGILNFTVNRRDIRFSFFPFEPPGASIPDVMPNAIHIRTFFFLTLFCVLGSVVRFFYGFIYTPWLQCPDHLAWQMIINEGSLSYDHLIYYPHEGGSVVVSLLAHLVQLVARTNSLTVAAFVSDLISRAIQLYVVWKIFSRDVAYIFGTWTIFAVPVIIPWATVNFGLHSISAFFPFVLIYVLWRDAGSRAHYIWTGIFLGLALWFSYSNFVLIVVYFIYQLLERKRGAGWTYSVVSFSAILVLHLLVRKYADAGFDFQEKNMASIRGTAFTVDALTNWSRYYQVWTGPLADSATMLRNSPYNLVLSKYIWLALVAAGFAGCIRAVMNAKMDKRIGVILLSVILFVTVYATSPFFYDYPGFGNYVAYRHLTYILPATALFTIAGLTSFRGGKPLALIFTAVCIYSSCLLFTSDKKDVIADRAAGWALGAKLGNKQGDIARIISSSPYNKKLVMQGVGWGITASLFEGSDSRSDIRLKEKVNALMEILTQVQESYRDDFIAGIEFSFSDGVTPVLDKPVREMLKRELTVRGYRKGITE